MGELLADGVPEVLEFDCPRCTTFTRQRFYGPCDPCVLELRSGQQMDKTDVVVADYVPKMNVTPNAVATKE